MKAKLSKREAYRRQLIYFALITTKERHMKHAVGMFQFRDWLWYAANDIIAGRDPITGERKGK